MNSSNPKFWALIGFGVGAVLAAAGSVATPLDSIVGGVIQAVIWFGVSSLIINKKKNKVVYKARDLPRHNSQIKSGFSQESSEEALSRLFSDTQSQNQPEDLEFKYCPMCAEQVRAAAKKCRFCQHLFVD
jgi:hypothetical protein